MIVASVGNVLVWMVWLAAAFACLGSAVAVVSFSNPFYSALALIGNLGSLAVLYLLLSSEFVAAAQVLVYAGAVMVMFLFVIAYVGPRTESPWTGGPSWQAIGAVLAAGALLVEIVVVIGLKAGGALATLRTTSAATLALRATSAACSSPTTCWRSRSRRSCCSSPRSAASSSARTRARAPKRCRRCDGAGHRPGTSAVAGFLFGDGHARRPDPAQPAHRAALARDHAQRREPGADRVRAPPEQRRRADLRAAGNGGRGLGGRRRARPDRRPQPQARHLSTSTGSAPSAAR